MAEINQFGKGIALNCGFDLGAQQLLDSRSIVADRTELEAIPNIRRANGLLVWIQDEKKLVVWDEPNSAWVEVSGDTSNIEQIASDLDNLTEYVRSNNDYYNDKVSELRTQISEIEVDDTFYSDKSYALTSAHGGLASGTDVSGWKIKDILKKILFPVNVPKLKIGGTSYNNAVVKLGFDDVISGSVSYIAGDFDIDYNNIKIYCNDELVETIKSGDEFSDISACLNAKTEIIAKADAIIDDDETDPNIIAWRGKTISSNAITCYAVRPLLYAWSTLTTPTLSTENSNAFADVYSADDVDDCMASYAWSSKPTELLTRSKTVTLNFSAQTSAARMVIASPYKIKTILNPSSFDITESFTMTTYYFDRRAIDEYVDQQWPQKITEEYEMTYLYVSNQTSQEKAYPLTVTFE